MRLPLRDMSLRTKLAASVALPLAVLAVFVLQFFSSRMDSVSRKWAERRAVGMALVEASAAAPGLAFDDAKLVEDLLRGLESAPGALYAVVYHEDKSVLAAWNGQLAPALTRPAGTDPIVTTVDGRLHVVVPVRAKGGANGALAMGFSLAEMQTEKRANLTAASGVAAIVLLAALVLSLLMGTLLMRPIGALTWLAGNIVSTGDLTQDVKVSSGDEIDRLSESFREMVQRQRAILLGVKQLVDGLARLSEQISRVGTTVAEGAVTIGARVGQTSAAVEENLVSLKSIADNVDVLHQSADQSSSALHQMAATNRAVSASVDTMSQAVGKTATAIEGMTRAVQDTSRNIEELNALIADTSTSMTELDSSFRTVQANAKDTATLSSTVTEDAERGVAAVQKTMLGINKIRDSSRAGAEVITRLGEDIAEVGKILGVITDVANQTNLLSLNAAIVAAQAGESGRSFAVVAGEIKQLADRTRQSTRDISTLVERIQQQSKNAVGAMDTSIKSVEDGVQLGLETEAALQKIVQSARSSTSMADAIAGATVEQVRSLQQITQAVHRIATTVEQINNVSREQATGSEQIMVSTVRMREFTSQVQRSSNEQTQASENIIKSLQNVYDMVSELRKAQHQQTESSEKVLGAVGAISEVSRHQGEIARELDAAIQSLQRQAASLEAEMARFQV